MYMGEIEQTLLDIMRVYGAQLPADQVNQMAQLVRHGEPGVAFENFCTQLYEYEVNVETDVRTKLKKLGDAMGIDPGYCDRLGTF